MKAFKPARQRHICHPTKLNLPPGKKTHLPLDKHTYPALFCEEFAVLQSGVGSLGERLQARPTRAFLSPDKTKFTTRQSTAAPQKAHWGKNRTPMPQPESSSSLSESSSSLSARKSLFLSAFQTRPASDSNQDFFVACTTLRVAPFWRLCKCFT